MKLTITRFAPSPTGIPHVGNIRTALFDFLLAKNQNGKFYLRIEDTDRKRIIQDAVGKIEDSLKKLSLNWDKKYTQSIRLDKYKLHLEILKKKNLVYEDEGAWRFKIGKGQKISWKDAVYSKIEFTTDVLEDFIIVKSDGFPTYHFASVVDDHHLGITHVLRGEEWISSTPKHLILYKALGWQPPTFVHLPRILGPDRKKLSKREGARSVFEYLNDGYLPEAIINFLALLGWAPKDEKEIYSLEELIQEFSLERINKNSPIFNLDKLRWFNNQWIKKITEKDLAQRIHKEFPEYEISQIKKIIPIAKERLFTLRDFYNLCSFFFETPPIIPKIEITIKQLQSAIVDFKKIKDWTAQNINNQFKITAEKSNQDRIKLIAATRDIISAKKITPPLYESMEILGKEEVIRRLESYEK